MVISKDETLTESQKPLPIASQNALPQASNGAQVPALRPAAPKPASRSKAWRWGAFGLIGALLAMGAYMQFGGAQPPVVAVEVTQFAPATRVLAVNGRTAAVTTVDMRPSVSGLLVAPLVAEGDVVVKDQIVAQVDTAAQNASIRQIMAGLDAALVAEQQATENYERAVALGSNISRSDLLAVTHAAESAGLEVTRQTASLDQAQIALENYGLFAPFDGTILSLSAELGQLVGPTSPLLTVADLDTLIVEADVDEAYATQISEGQTAVLQLSGETMTRDAHISYVSKTVDVSTGGLAVEMSFDAPVTAPTGLTVTANIIVEQREEALTIPRTALLAGTQDAGVFVVRDGKAVLQKVAIVDWPADRLIVTSGLGENDVVVLDASGISAGQVVEVEQP